MFRFSAARPPAAGGAPSGDWKSVVLPDSAHDGERLDPLWLTFADAALEARFREDFARRGRYFVQFTLVFAALLAVAALVAGREETATAVTSVLLAGAALAASTRKKAFLRWAQPLLAAGLLVVGGVLAAETAGRAGTRLVDEVDTVIVLVYALLLLRLRFPIALGCGAAVAAATTVAHPVTNDFYVCSLAAMLATAAHNLEAAQRRDFCLEARLFGFKRQARELLHNTIPDRVAARLMASLAAPDGTVADACPDATVVVVEVDGLAEASPALAVAALNELFTTIDDVVLDRGLEKVRSSGGTYVFAGGLERPGEQTRTAVRVGMEAVRLARLVSALPLQVRVGVGRGRVAAGVVGRERFCFDLWGPAILAAAELSRAAAPGQVRFDAGVRERLMEDSVLRLVVVGVDGVDGQWALSEEAGAAVQLED